jgi:hypothetical protein
MSNQEQSIQRALNELEKGLFPSIRQATEYHHVPKFTAAYRRAGRPSVAQTDRKFQRLSKEEEKLLIQYFGTFKGRIYALITLEFDESSPKSCRVKGTIRHLESIMLHASYSAIQSSKRAKLGL